MAFSNKEVETRVVEMEFDNKQFEKGAEQTMGTLEKLKKSLNFDNTNSGLDNLQKSINKVSFKGLTDQVSSIESAFTTLAGRIKVNFFDQIANYIINAGAQLERSTIGQIISGGKSRAMNIATAKFKMEGMGVTWEQIYKDLDYAVAGTAYGLDAAANIGSQLVASGVQVGDDMATALRAVSGVAAMTSSSYEDIGNVFAAVAGQGKVMAMQLSQLSLRGINAYATLGKYLNMTEAEVRDVVSKGEIDFQTFANAMDEAFGEHAKEANKTFTGAMSNVKAALSKVGQMFYSPFYDAMIDPLNQIRETINDVKNALQDTSAGASFADNLAEIVKQGGEILNVLIKIVRVGINDLLPGVEKLNTKMNGIINTMKSVKKWMEKAIPEDMRSKMDDVKNGMEGITQAEIDAAHKIWEEDSLGKGQERISNLTKLGLSYERVQKVMDLCASANVNVDTALKQLGVTIDDNGKLVEKTNESMGESANNAKAIINVLKVIKIIFKDVKKVLGEAKKAFDDVFGQKSAIGESKNYNVFLHLSNSLLTFIKSIRLTKNDLHNLREAFSGFFQIFKFFGEIIRNVINMFNRLNNELNHGDSIFLEFLGGFGAFVNELLTAWRTEGKVTDFFESITDHIIDMWNAFEKFWGFKPTEIFEHIYESSKKVTDYLSSHTLKEGVTYLIEQFKEFFKIFKKDDNAVSIFDTIKTKVSNIGGYLGSAIKVLKDFWEAAVDFIKNITYIFTGKWDKLAAQGKEGLAEHFKLFSDSVDEVVESFLGAINRLIDKVGTTDSTSVTQAANNVSSMSGSIVDMFGNVKTDIHIDKENIQSALVDIKAVVAIFNSFLATISFYKLSDGIQSMGNGFEGLASSVKTLSKTAKSAAKRISKSLAFKYVAEGLKAIGFALLEIVLAIGALVLIANLDEKDSWLKATIAIGVIMASLVALAAFISRLTSFSGAFALLAFAAVLFGFAAAMGIVIWACKAVQDNEKLKERLETVAGVILKIGGTLIGITTVISLIYKGVSKAIRTTKTGKDFKTGKVRKEVAPDTPISDLAWVMLGLAGSVLLLTGAIAILGKMNPSTVEAGLGYLGAMLTMITAAVTIMIASTGIIKPGNAAVLDGLVDLLKALFKQILVMTLAMVMLSSVFALLLNAGDVGWKAIGLASMVMIGFFAVLGVFIGAMFDKINKDNIDYTKMKAMSKIIDSISILCIGLTLAMTAMIASIAIGGTEAFGTAVVSFIVIMGFIMALLKEVMEYSSKIELDALGKASDKYTTMVYIIKSLTKCLLAISAALVVMALVNHFAGIENMALGAASLIAVFFLIWDRMTKTIEGAKWGANKTDKIYESISKAFLRIAVSLIAIAAAMSLMIFTVTHSDIGAVDALQILGSFIAGIALIFGALYFLNDKITLKDADNIIKIAGAFAIIAAGIGVLAVALGAMMLLAKGSTVDFGGILLMLSLLVGVISAAVIVATKLTDTADIFQSGVSLAVVFVAFAVAILAIGAALKLVAEMNIKDEVLEEMTKLVGILALLGAAVVAISAIPTFSGLNALAAALSVFGVLASAVGALFILAQVDWKSLEYGLTVLENHAAGLTTLAILAAGITALAYAGGIDLAIDIAAVAAAVAFLSIAIYLLVGAIGALLELTGKKPPEVDTYKYGAQQATDSVDGFVDTMRASGDEVYDATAETTSQANQAMSDVTDSHSPSRVAMWYGEMYGAGLVEGIESEKVSVYNASQALGTAMADGFAESMDAANPMKYIQTISGEMVQAYGDSIQTGFESAQDSIQDGFGDFTFDYSEAFDNAPVTPTITPVIDSEELDDQVQAVRQDEALGLTPTIDLSGLESLNLDTSSITDSLTGNLFGDENGKGGLLNGIKDIFVGDDGLFGSDGIDGMVDKFNEKLNLPSEFDDITALLSNSTGLGKIMANVGDSFKTEMSSLGDTITGEKGLGKVIGSISIGNVTLEDIADILGKKSKTKYKNKADQAYTASKDKLARHTDVTALEHVGLDDLGNDVYYDTTFGGHWYYDPNSNDWYHSTL